MAAAVEAVALAAEVEARLNAGAAAGAFSRPFLCAREYDPERPLEEMGQRCWVTVLAARRRSRRITRTAWEHDYDIEVGIQQRVERGDKAELDELMRLPAELSTYFGEQELTDYPAAQFFESGIDPLYAPEHLRQHSVFTSVVTLTFRTHE